MGPVDLADQLRVVLQPDYRCRKGWKALYRYLLSTTVTNC